MSSRVLIVFARSPVAGKTKQRLRSKFGARGANHIYKRLFTVCLARNTVRKTDQVVLSGTPSARHPFFRLQASRFSLRLIRQPTGDLGQRMYRAFRAALRTHDHAVLIGSDCPSLGHEHIEQAWEALEAGADLVTVAAADGGYVLIGMSRAERRLFEGIEWGGPRVYAKTRARARRCGFRLAEIATLWDVDYPRDVKRARREGLI